MIQFSKELYDTGKYEVVYRNGEKVKDIAFLKGGLICSLNYANTVFTHTEDGGLRNFNHSNSDLLLIPKGRWANVYKGADGIPNLMYKIFDSKEEAMKDIIIPANYLETVKLVSE
jgi:hypothetical protein